MDSLPWLALGVLAALAISASHILSVVALRRLALPAFLAARSLAALVFTLPWLAHFDAARLDARGWALLAASLLLSPFLIGILYFRGLSTGRIATQNALRQVSPAFIVLWQFFALGLPIPPGGWLGVAFTVSGGALVFAGSRDTASATALAFGLAAAAVHAAAMLVQAELLPLIDARALIAAQNLVFALLTGAWCLGRRHAEPAPSGRRPWPALLLALVAGLLVQVVFDRLKLAVLPELGPFRTACLILLQLPFTAALAWRMFGERLDSRQSLALGFIFAGALLGSS